MSKLNQIAAPIYIRKDPVGAGAYLHDKHDRHLGYIHTMEVAEAIVAAVNASDESVTAGITPQAA